MSLPDPINVMKKGVIADLRTVVWTGEVNTTTLRNAGIDFSLGPDLKSLLPQRHLKRLKSVVTSRRREFKLHVLRCSWGDFIPVTAIEPWIKKEKKFIEKLNEITSDLDADSQHIVEETRVKARALSFQVWKAKKLGANAPPVSFCQEVERKVVSLLPKRYSAMFCFVTDYHTLPPVAFSSGCDPSVAKILEEYYAPIREDVASIFIREIMGDLRSRVKDSCAVIRNNFGRTTGRIREVSLARFDSFLESLSVLWTSSDPRVQSAIIDLQNDLKKCYTEHDKILEKVSVLEELASELLDASKLGL